MTHTALNCLGVPSHEKWGEREWGGTATTPASREEGREGQPTEKVPTFIREGPALKTPGGKGVIFARGDLGGGTS